MRASTNWRQRWKWSRRLGANVRFAGLTLLRGGAEFLATGYCPINLVMLAREQERY
ncbi:MAG TPA: hypothetical protein VKM93_25845 [Terriglobia bacterium]|nr:hypothetical protein [Terriglobia bacterium]